MGTRFELIIDASELGEARARAAGEQAMQIIEHWHNRLSRFVTSSDVSKLNRERSGLVDGELRELFVLCEDVWRASGGAFDVVAATRAEASRAAGGAGTAVSGSALELGGAGANRVHLAAWASLDLGAVGKGWAIDRAIESLRESGVRSALLHGGTSSVAAIGTDPAVVGREDGWRVQIRSAGEPIDVQLHDRALGVSAAAGHRGAGGADDSVDAGLAGERPHLVDPSSGAAVGSSVVDTTAVIGESAAVCDAWSTALAVLGARGGAERGITPRLPAAYESLVHGPGGWQATGETSGASLTAGRTNRTG